MEKQEGQKEPVGEQQNNSEKMEENEKYSQIYDLIWHDLLDEKISQEQLKSIMGEEGLQQKQFLDKDDEGNDKIIDYLTYKEIGISFCLENNEFNSVFVYNKFDKIMKAYKGKLPYNLNMDLKNADVVAQLGDPARASGGKTVPICLTYEHLGLEITFLTKIWEDSASPIEFICLFQKNMSEKYKLCGMCKKETQLLCQKCSLVYYCSRNCQSSHWKVHKKFCVKNQ